ncbi:predicted protein [Postia placenta Mad-698-R]|nr:predicted protein [Postia placenta Mad-698-R]
MDQAGSPNLSSTLESVQIPDPAHDAKAEGTIVAVEVIDNGNGSGNAVPLDDVPPIAVNAEASVSDIKRRPGRPKKQPAPAEQPRVKRPVGRPRKDGLPAGSVGPRRPTRPRKRPPGTFAAQQSISAPFPYAVRRFFQPQFNFPPPESMQTQWRASVPPMASLQRPPPAPRPVSHMSIPIDPSLDRDNWPELSRTRPDIFLHTLVMTLQAPNLVSSGGPTVEEAFKSHLVSLTPNKNAPSIPTLYSILKTFWLPSSPVYFSLTSSASTTRTPSDHRFFYWDPHTLVFNGIACPACSAPLMNRGRIGTGPIKVYDLHKPFFIIGCEYQCKSPVCVAAAGTEGRRFASTDLSILRALPPKLRDEFPALLIHGVPDLGSGPEIWNWQGMGVSIALWNMVHASLRTGSRKETILEIIQAVQQGVPEDYAPFPPMPLPQQLEQPIRGEEEEEEEEDTQEAAQVEGDLEYPKDKTTDEFNEAWHANSGAVEVAAGGVPGEAGPSTVAAAALGEPNGNAGDQPAPPPPPFAQFGQPAPPPMYQPYGYIPYPYLQAPGEANAPNPNVLKRTFSIVDGTPDPEVGMPLHKRVRHCCKCGSNECKGKGGRSFCQNPCQDCGKVDCKGRNNLPSQSIHIGKVGQKPAAGVGSGADTSTSGRWATEDREDGRYIPPQKELGV